MASTGRCTGRTTSTNSSASTTRRFRRSTTASVRFTKRCAPWGSSTTPCSSSQETTVSFLANTRRSTSGRCGRRAFGFPCWHVTRRAFAIRALSIEWSSIWTLRPASWICAGKAPLGKVHGQSFKAAGIGSRHGLANLLDVRIQLRERIPVHAKCSRRSNRRVELHALPQWRRAARHRDGRSCTMFSAIPSRRSISSTRPRPKTTLAGSEDRVTKDSTGYWRPARQDAGQPAAPLRNAECRHSLRCLRLSHSGPSTSSGRAGGVESCRHVWLPAPGGFKWPMTTTMR